MTTEDVAKEFFPPVPEASTEPADDVVVDGHPQETAVYAVRWYLVLLFGTATMWQSALANPSGPIDTSLKTAYPHVWTDGQIAMQGNWAAILATLFFLPAGWLTEVLGE
jgi:hypothetical protein